MKCPQCGESNPRERLECSRCGGPLLDALAGGDVTGTHQLTATRMKGPAASAASGETTASPGPTELPGSILRPDVSGPTSPSLSGELAIKSVFANRYEILALLGQGGMGRVYAARDRELDRVIALKTIKADEESGVEAIQRFKHELILARKITHKNVVRIHDLGDADGVKFFTMELIEGESLKTLIRRRGRIPFADAVALARQILGALEEAHSQGVVHRDLKPQNIMVDPSGTPYLMDFGIARSVETTGMTATGTMVGTPDYMSPEQARGEKAGPQSDIFSFGVILYEMLTGELPFQADSAFSRIVMRLTHKPRAPRELSAEIPAYLERVVLKCMQVELPLRYSSAAEIQGDLDRREVSRSLTVRVQQTVKRRRGAIAAAAALAVIAVGGYWAASRRAAVVAPAGPVQTLAIVPFTNASGSKELEWLRTGLPEMLVTDLSQSSYIRPVPGDRVSHVLQQAGLAEQSRFDEAALESVSKLAPAQSVLSGQFVESAGRLRLDLSLRKAGSGVTIPIKVEAGSTEVFGLVDKITGQVKQHMDLSPAQVAADTDRPISEVSTASLEALRSYQAGLAELRKGANQAAIPLFKQAATRDPGFAMAYAKLADANVNVGAWDDAEAAADKARALAEKAAIPLVERYEIHASVARAKEDHKTAAATFAELAKLYPDDPDIQFQLGKANEDMGKLPEAIEAYKRTVQAAPDYGAALLGLGRALVLSGRHEEAIGSLEQALRVKQFEGDLEARGMIEVILGVAYENIHQYDKALEHFALSLDYREKAGYKRGQAATLSNIGDVYRALNQMDKALQAQQKAIRIAREIGDKKGESAYLVSLGMIYERQGNLDKQLAAYRQSLQIEMERQDAVALANRENHIAEIYRQKGQYEDALVYLEQARNHLAQSDATYEKALNFDYIGLVRRAQGLYDKAIEAFLAALPLFKQVERETGVAAVQQDLAGIYARQGRYGDAYASLEQSLEIYVRHKSHDVADVQADLAHLLIAMGQLEAADKMLKEAAQGGQHEHGGHDTGPSPQVLLGQAELAHLRGRAEPAAKAYEEANVSANLSGQKEVAVRSRIALGRLYLEQGKLDNAERMLVRTRQEAGQARLRPLEAEALAVLAQVYLAQGKAEPARKAALDAIGIAEKFEGRPSLFRAEASLGEALDLLGRKQEAAEAWARAAATLDWMRGSLRPEDVDVFMRRPDVQKFLASALPRLEQGGRGTDAASLRKWLEAPAARAAS
jgi:tetratricopeptide (TPR) repeat protein